ncbi:hypothetical protein EUGRSUZ_B01707 [Eucalyptus grandis]|uniref:Uncharacterized protein n=2 Tax=Eucalyptus grandis TaxID=71139 RepID=A0ACC3LS90_EUCGR|nr:hypothetical protein EUGRSUZ_B01707 [Eucalyptus grandis]
MRHQGERLAFHALLRLEESVTLATLQEPRNKLRFNLPEWLFLPYSRHETWLCKNLIQEYVQKLSYVIPWYECRKDEASRRAPLFSCTVEVGGICYTGDTARTKKQAKIQAARTALLHETGLCKNLIQEYVQKLNYVIPRYECPKDEASRRAPPFSCTVEVGGIYYTGDTARTKKQAEIQAARTALLAVQSSIPTDSQLTVSCKKRATETAPFNVRHSSPENSRMNQNGEDDAAQEQLSLRRSAPIRARQNPQCF